MSKSNEVKLNKALAKLKERAPASKFQEVSGEIAKLCPNIEAQLKLVKEALEVLKEASPLGLSNIEEAKRDYPALFGVEPWPTKQPTTESKPVVKKHNGVTENFSESNPLQRADGKSAPVTETDNTRKDPFAKGDKVMLEAMEARGQITKDEKRFLMGKKSIVAKEAYKKFSDRQKKEFDGAILLGFNESDALKLATL
jgi:hypothetical protein